MAGRPSTVEGVRACLGQMGTDAGRERGLGIDVRASDVFVATYPKCGTTWMQQIVHCLRTDGSRDFGEIGDVVPWLEMAHDLAQDPDAEQVAAPRAFKTHFHWLNVPRGGRYINAVRAPAKVAVSLYRFFEGWLFESGTIDIDTFIAQFFIGGSGSGRYWDHVNAWWQARNRDDVLLLCYEEMLDAPAEHIARIAAFIGVPCSESLLKLTVEQSSRDFMAAHGSQFDDHVVRTLRDPVMGLPPGGDTTKVQARVADAARYRPSAATIAAIEQCWQDEVAPRTKLASYPAMRQALATTGAVA